MALVTKPEPIAPEPPAVRRAMELAVRALSPRQVETTNLSVVTTPIIAGARVLAYRQAIPIAQDSIVVFADEMPGANWSHPCRYILCNARTGEPYTEIAARFPPEMRTPKIALRTFHEPIALRPGLYWPIRPRPGCFKRVPKGKRYAILFSGASNARHVNDMEFLYRTLRDHYGMPDADIICLNHDGTLNYNGNPKPIAAWPGDNTAYRMPIKGKGTKADLDAALDDIAARLKPEDSLLIHTNNHGGWGGWGKSYLCVQSGADYFAADFAAKLKTLPKFRCLVVMMEQCHAGGFNAPIIANSPAQYTSVASATVEDQSSWGNAEFDFFARDWIAAMAGHTPYGGALASNPDSNGDGTISAREAYDYADSIHYSGDTPNWSQSSATARTCHLAQRYGWAWTWFCPIVIDLLYPVWEKLPIPEFYDRFRKGIAPVLDEFEVAMEKDAAAARGALEKRLKEAIARTF
ncbi:C13 family peptidase [Elioraea sp.]|uniref:C13 family peptidase n=1 Tax=Elioraea sp. TaxID=2185103 RepID=UPI003F72C9AD